jgi:hypothetical protein
MKYPWMSGSSPGVRPDTVLKGWPTPTVDEALQYADQNKTKNLAGTDGQSTWAASGSALALVPGKTFYRYNGMQFWPDPAELKPGPGDWFGAPVMRTLELLRRADNPALVGLRVTERYTGPLAHRPMHDTETDHIPLGRYEHIYWMNPGRNLVPVEDESFIYTEQGRKLTSYKYEYLDFAQMADGRWYPTHWRVPSPEGEGKYWDFRLTFESGRNLEDRWFNDLNAHYDHGAMQRPGSQRRGQHAPAAAIVVVQSAWRWWPWALAAVAFILVGILLLLQRRQRASAAPLRGFAGPRRNG